MRIKITDEQSSGIHISILLAVAFCIGIYLASTAVLIARDGIIFIEYAKNLDICCLKTIKNEYQHPGYPFLIAAAHKIVEAEYDGSSLWSWIYSAQAATLIFRLLAVASLYFVGKELVGKRFSFWAILILILLPVPAKLGSDALSDWPHIFFLSTGFLLLILGAASRKWWLFGFAGFSTGIGYLIRPECAQVVVFGYLWLILQMFWSQRIMSRGKAVIALVVLLVGFLIPALPYMRLKAAVFPKKQLVQLVPKTQFCGTREQEVQAHPNSVYTASLALSDTVKALGKLVERVSETLMWFFVPVSLIGMHKYFRKRNWLEPERFFIIVLIAFNILIMTLLYCKHGYMSRRHTLPLVVFTIFYVPAGLEVLASWLDKELSKTMGQLFTFNANANFWFLVLLVTGISICSPKLLKPIRMEKQNYRDAAQWLAKNTNENDIIATSDARISFYSERKGIQYDDEPIPKGARYLAVVVKSSSQPPNTTKKLEVKKVFENHKSGSKVIIYQIP